MENTIKNSCGGRGCRVIRLPYDRKPKKADLIKKTVVIKKCYR